MARRQVVEVACDRCKRTETQGTDEDPNRRAGTGKELTVTFHGQTVEYDDLCRRCRRAVDNYYQRMTRQEDDTKAEEDPESPVTDLVEVQRKKGFLGR